MRPVGQGALRKAAVTSSEAKEKLGKDAAHETKYRIMPVSRSVVEVRPNVSSVNAIYLDTHCAWSTCRF